MEGELKLFLAVFQPVGRGYFQVIIRRFDNAITLPRCRRANVHKLFGEVRKKLRAVVQFHGCLGREPRGISIRRLRQLVGHEGAAARRAKNQQDGQEQPTQPLPFHPACLTCFRSFAIQNLLPKPTLIAITPMSAARRAPVADCGVFLSKPQGFAPTNQENRPVAASVPESCHWGIQPRAFGSVHGLARC